MKKRYFTVGPSAIHPICPQETQNYYNLGYGSESHRSSIFKSIYQNLDEQLRVLMSIPESHAIYIASSGSEIFERILQNCVLSSSFHFINGAFSSKFFNYAERLHINAHKYEIAAGEIFGEFIPDIPEEVDLICITHNETSTGIKTPESYIHAIKKKFPNKKIAVDTVSSAPFCSFDYSLVDMTFFSSQKAFGMPAGLGIWIINKELVQFYIVNNKTLYRGAHNTLVDFEKNYALFQTPSTPNTLGVYLMSKVAEEMNKQGIATLTNDMMRKKEYLSSIFTDNEWLTICNRNGSDTIIITKLLQDKNLTKLFLEKNQIMSSSGYGNFAETQLRFSNFPANSMEDIEYLGSIFKKFS